MAQSASRQRFQAARDARARGEGWTGYGQKRAAGGLGWHTPAEYHRAKAARPSITAPVAASPFAPKRRLNSGGVVGTYGARVGIETPFTPAALDGPRGLRSELARYRDDRRIQLWIGDVLVFKRGMSLGYFRGLVDAAGSLDKYVRDLAARAYASVRGATTVTVTLT